LEGGIGGPQRLDAVSAIVVRGFFQLDSCILERSNGRVDARMARLTSNLDVSCRADDNCDTY